MSGRLLACLRKMVHPHQSRQSLALPLGDGRLDEVVVEPSGLIHLRGWSRSPLPDLQVELLVDGRSMQPDLTWRTARPDVSQSKLLGVCFEYRLQCASVSRAEVLSSGQRAAVAFGGIKLYSPDYAQLIDGREVLGREQIYGSGPPVPHVHPDVATLAGIISGRCVDVGCGAGALVSLLRSCGVDACGIEIDRPEIRANLMAAARPFVRLYEGGTLPYDSKSFDWVTAIEVIEHVPEFRVLVEEMTRVGRNLLITVPDVSAIPTLHRHGVVPWHMLEATHLNFFTQSSLTKVLADYFGNIDAYRIGRFEVNGTEAFTSLALVCRS